MKKQLVRAVSWLSNKLAKAWSDTVKGAGSGAKATSKVKVFSTIWKAVDVALTGWVIYDMFQDDSGDSIKGSSQTWLHVILNRASTYAVLNVFEDNRAVADAFASQAGRMLSESGELKNLYGLTFAATSEYITQYPDPNSIALTYDAISKELAALTSELEDKSKSEDVKDAISAAEELKIMLKEAGESSPASLRLCDFAAFAIRFISDVTGVTSPGEELGIQGVAANTNQAKLS